MRTRLFFSVSLIALLLRALCPAAELAQPASVDEVLGILKSNVPAGLTEADPVAYHTKHMDEIFKRVFGKA